MKFFRLALVAGALAFPRLVHADDDAALLQQLPTSKHSLADGIRQVTQSKAIPLAAKYKIENSTLQLIVWEAKKGFDKEPQYNVLEQRIGPVSQPEWKPDTRPFTDSERPAKAAAQFALWAVSKKTLLDIVTTAEKNGTVIGAEPRFEGRKPFVWVRVAEGGTVRQMRYDIFTGERIPGGAPAQLSPDKDPSLPPTSTQNP